VQNPSSWPRKTRSAGFSGTASLGPNLPSGNLYDLPTLMDKALEDDDHIMFQAGTHDKSIKIKMDDYRKIVKPKIVEFSYQMGS